jgi:hypothetical protein
MIRFIGIGCCGRCLVVIEKEFVGKDIGFEDKLWKAADKLRNKVLEKYDSWLQEKEEHEKRQGKK